MGWEKTSNIIEHLGICHFSRQMPNNSPFFGMGTSHCYFPRPRWLNKHGWMNPHELNPHLVALQGPPVLSCDRNLYISPTMWCFNPVMKMADP
jgi:hypothetical protein